MNKIAKALDFARKHGMVAFANEWYYRSMDDCYERYFNVTTRGVVSKEELGLDHHESLEYASVSYRHIFGAFQRLPIDKKDATLLDYGCGKGRALVAAAACGYKKIIGVELSGIIEASYSNIERMRHRKTQEVEIKRCDATQYTVPADVNVIYFFNPFIGSVLDKVINNIRSSYTASPRTIHIIYFNNGHFDKIVANQGWLTKTLQSGVYPDISCGLYQTNVSGC